MMQMQGTELQDTIGRLLGPQGMQSAKIGQVMQTMNMMGLEKNQGGFATAGLAMGFSNDYMKTLMSEVGSPGYWKNLQQQRHTQKMEMRGLAEEERERNRPGYFRRKLGHTGDRLESDFEDMYAGMRNFGEGLNNFFSTDEQERLASKRGQVVLRTDDRLLNTTDDALRRSRAISRTDYEAAKTAMQEMGTEYGKRRHYGRTSTIFGTTDAWDKLRGGDSDNLRQLRQVQGESQARWGGGIGETIARYAVTGVTGAMNIASEFWNGGISIGSAIKAINTGSRQSVAAADRLFGSEADHQKDAENYAKVSDMWREGSNLSVDDRSKKMTALAKKAGISENKLQQIVTRASLQLGKKAVEDAKDSSKSGLMTNETATARVRAAAAEMLGIKESEVSDDLIKGAGALAKEDADITISGGRTKAFVPADMVNAKSHKQYIDLMTKSQDFLSEKMFGSLGEDTAKGSGTRRAQLQKTIFSGTSSPKVLLLAALGAAARTSPAAAAAWEQEMNAPTTSQTDRDQAKLKSKQFEEDTSNIANIQHWGATLAALPTDKRLGVVEAERQGSLAIGRDLSERVGKRSVFGAGVDSSKSTEELLAGDTSKLKGEIRQYAEKYQIALSKGDKKGAAQIVEEASEFVEEKGFNMAATIMGGTGNPVTDEASDAQSDIEAKQAAETKGMFPDVKAFDSATRELMRAAKMLTKQNDTSDLHPDVPQIGTGMVG
jgi:hypothetical protein